MERGDRVKIIEGSECTLPKKEYIIERLDFKHVTRGDGPGNQFKWAQVFLKGVKDPQWARDFEKI